MAMDPSQDESVIISNIPKANAQAALQAIIETRYAIHIRQDAFDCHGNPLLDYVSLWSSDRTDKGPFWKRYRELTDK